MQKKNDEYNAQCMIKNITEFSSNQMWKETPSTNPVLYRMFIDTAV